METSLDVFCADIGSISGGNFGWYAHLAGTTTAGNTDIHALTALLAKRLNVGVSVALGFEAPMFVPLRTNTQELTKHREGETNPNWIGGPGSAVLATALAQVPWILGNLKAKLTTDARATLSWNEFASGVAKLFLWEAFVSGTAKGTSHIEDARIAVRKFEAALPDPDHANAIREPAVMSLLGAALLRTGWSDDPSLLAQSCIVIRA